MKIILRISLAVTSGLLLATAWYEKGSGLILLFALIPLLFLEDEITASGRKKRAMKVYWFTALAFLVWNMAATWWIFFASFYGLLAAVIVSTLYMAIPFGLYSLSKRLFGRITGYMALIFFWIAFEFAYNHGELSWPWLSLGNGFLYSTKLIQWYEVTGIFGGTLWVLLVNILLYDLFRRLREQPAIRKQLRLTIVLGLLIIVPITASLIRYYTYTEKKDPREIVVVQPNIDPYKKFMRGAGMRQARIQQRLAAGMITEKTEYVVCPETSITGLDLDVFMQERELQLIKNFVLANPRLKYVTGIKFDRSYERGQQSETANWDDINGEYYDTYNSAIQIDSTDFTPLYHKSQLVTGVEKMPYTWLFKPLEQLMLDLGGTFRSYVPMDERVVFQAPDEDIRIAPVICYESVFGEYVGEYIEKGANYIFVITNDGWWKNTPGHRQHNAMSSLRAIETRRSVARSANTGISCFINQRGDVMQSLGWWKEGALRQELNANDTLTFYVRYGDVIGRFGFFAGILMLLLIVVRVFFPARFRG